MHIFLCFIGIIYSLLNASLSCSSFEVILYRYIYIYIDNTIDYCKISISSFIEKDGIEQRINRRASETDGGH